MWKSSKVIQCIILLCSFFIDTPLEKGLILSVVISSMDAGVYEEICDGELHL